jgi:hypothetical protein
MMSRSLAGLTAALGVFAILFTLSAPAMADPVIDLAEAEAAEASATASKALAEEQVGEAQEVFAPIARRAARADAAAAQALQQARRVRDEAISDRKDAAREVAAAEADYDSEKSSHETLGAIGIGLAVLSIVVALGGFAYAKFRTWPLSRRWTQAAGGALGLALLGGLAIAVIPSSPDEPQFSAETLELARYAEGDPAVPPTAEMSKSREEAKPLVARAARLDRQRAQAQRELAAAKASEASASRELLSAEGDADSASEAIERLERREAREAREEAEFEEEFAEEGGGGGCDPNYSGCVPDTGFDVDCDEVGETVEVIGTDVDGLDADGDGIGCESS